MKMRGPGSSQTAYAMLTFSAILWAVSTVAAKLAVTSIPPFTVGTIRLTLTTVVLVGFLLWKEKGSFFPPKRDWPILIFLGMVGMFGTNAVFFIGIKYSTATNSALIIAGSPIVISIFSVMLLKESLGLGQLAAVLLSFIGVVLVITQGSWTVITNLSFNIGDLILLANPVCWGLYTVLSQKLMHRYTPLAIATYSTFIGDVFFIPLMISEHPWANQVLHSSVTGWIAIGYMGLIGSTLGTFWWNKGIVTVGANRAGIFMNGVPIIAVFLSVLLLGEQVTLVKIFGATLVISGVFLNSLRTGVKRNLTGKDGAVKGLG